MKKIIIATISIILLAFCLFSLASCSNKVGEIKNIKLNTDTLVISWDRVLGATGYTVVVKGQDFQKTSKQNNYSLEYLTPGVYEIQIRANGNGKDSYDSGWVTYEFERKEESGLKYKLINNGTEYELIGIGSASGDIVMEDEYRGKPVTSIADKAFAGNGKVTSFKVGKYVKSIGDSAFARCNELASFELSDSVVEIGERCFQSCKKMESFAFTNSVVDIPDYMFCWCSELKTVTFGNATQSVGIYAFSNCDKLSMAILPDTLTRVGEYAFSDCSAMTEVNLGNGVKTIEPYAFYNCVTSTEFNLGQSLETIGEYAFGNCDSMASITIPDSCTSIDSYAFRYCDILESVTLGNSLSYIGGGVFLGTKLLEDAEESLIIGNWYILLKDNTVTKATIPAGIRGVANGAFAKCKELLEVNLPDVKYICDNAFYGCSKLQMAIFGNELVSIGSYAFRSCSELTRITLGNSLVTIGDYAFSQCKKLLDKNIALPESLRSIGAGAFNGAGATPKNGVLYIGKWAVGLNSSQNVLDKIGLERGTIGIANYAFSKAPLMQTNYSVYGIDIPDSVEYIGRGAFYQVTAFGTPVTIHLPANLKVIGDYAFYGDYAAVFGDGDMHLVIPSNTEYIGRSAFYGCSSIYSLTIPESVKTISPYAFYGCSKIGATIVPEDETEPEIPGSFTIDNGVQSIGDKAFYGCSSIQNVVIPDSVTSLGKRVFYKCEGIKSVVIGAGISEIPDYTFYNCTLLERVAIPNNIVRIGNYAFRGCASLKSLDLGNSVEEVGNFAFFGAEYLQSLTIPSSVKSIGTHAFRGMTRVKSIVLPASVENIYAHAFYGAVNAVIYVDGDVSKEWHARWNSSYAVVITNCVLSSDKSYLVSFVLDENNPDNLSYTDEMPSPVKAGYEFVGFATSPNTDAQYTLAEMDKIPLGTTLYTVWALNETNSN